LPAFDLAVLAYLLVVACGIAAMVRARRARRRSYRARMAEDAHYRADVLLWNLLSEEDPYWLWIMGIEPPLYVQRERARTCANSGSVGSIINAHPPEREHGKAGAARG
jgi:hypothetical protein